VIVSSPRHGAIDVLTDTISPRDTATSSGCTVAESLWCAVNRGRGRTVRKVQRAG